MGRVGGCVCVYVRCVCGGVVACFIEVCVGAAPGVCGGVAVTLGTLRSSDSSPARLVTTKLVDVLW